MAHAYAWSSRAGKRAGRHHSEPRTRRNRLVQRRRSLRRARSPKEGRQNALKADRNGTRARDQSSRRQWIGATGLSASR